MMLIRVIEPRNGRTQLKKQMYKTTLHTKMFSESIALNTIAIILYKIGEHDRITEKTYKPSPASSFFHKTLNIRYFSCQLGGNI
jgi:hypothetical protein